MSVTSGIYPPISDGGTAARIPLQVSWLDGPVVAMGSVAGDVPAVTDVLVEGVYLIWTDGPVWINTGDDGGSVDPSTTGAGACWPHDGPYWDFALREGQRIALRRRPRPDESTGPTLFRIKKVA